MVRTTATHIDEASRLLASTGSDRASARDVAVAMQSGGTKLRETGVFASVIETGDALLRAGQFLKDQQPQAAAEILQEAGLRVIAEEKPLMQEQ